MGFPFLGVFRAVLHSRPPHSRTCPPSLSCGFFVWPKASVLWPPAITPDLACHYTSTVQCTDRTAFACKPFAFTVLWTQFPKLVFRSALRTVADARHDEQTDTVYVIFCPLFSEASLALHKITKVGAALILGLSSWFNVVRLNVPADILALNSSLTDENEMLQSSIQSNDPQGELIQMASVYNLRRISHG